MLDFSKSVMSVFLWDDGKTPTVNEIVWILKQWPYEVSDIDFSGEEYWVWEAWSFSATFNFWGEKKKFGFALKYIQRTLEDYFMDNDVYNYYIMTPKKIYDKKGFWDLGIVADITDDELEGFHKMLKVVSLFKKYSKFFRDNSSYTIRPIEYALYSAWNLTPPSYRDLFHIQQFLLKSWKENKVWIHTHGLERLWYSEIEVVDVNDYSSKPFYKIIESLAYIEMEDGEPEEGESFDIWNGLKCELLTFDEVIPNFKNVTIWKISDRLAHGNVSTNILTFVKKWLFGMKKFINPKEFTSLIADDYLDYISQEEIDRQTSISREKISVFESEIRDNSKDKKIFASVKDMESEEYITGEVLNLVWDEIMMEDIDDKEIVKFDKNKIATWFIEDKGRNYNADTLYMLKK